MPLAGDAFLNGGQQLPAPNNPLNRMQLGSFNTTFDLADIIESVKRYVTDLLFPAIEELTGVDLSAFLPIINTVVDSLTTLFGDLNPSSGTFDPLDAITTFINLMVEVGANLPLALITELTGFTGGVPILSQLIGLFTGTTGGLTGLSGLGSIFGDLTGLLGNPTALGSGTPILGSAGSIPLLEPLIEEFVSLLGGVGAGTGLGGLTTIFEDLLGVLGNPTGLGSGTPGVGSLGSIPLLGPVFGLFGGATSATQAGNFFTNLLSFLGTPTLTGSTGSFDPTTVASTFINDILNPTGLLASIEAIVQALTGQSGGSLNILGPLTGLFGPIIDLFDGTGSTTGASNFTDNGDGTGFFDLGLGDLVDNGDGTAMSVFGLLQNLTGLLGTFQSTADRQQNIIDAIFNALNFTNITGNFHDDALQSALQNIPFLNILGIGGPADIGGSIQGTWDNLISGLVGVVGSGAGLSDLFNIAQGVSSNAAKGGFSWDILGIRNNTLLDSGMLPTSRSNFALSRVALQSSAPTFAVTQAASTIGFTPIPEARQIGVVRWHGSGNANISDFRVNVWKMDRTTGAMTLVHNSANIIGDIPAAAATPPIIAYSLPTAIAAEATDCYGFELTVTGSGTHNVVGSSTWMPNDAAAFPKNWAATRNSGGVAPPPTIATGSVSYATNVAFFEHAVTLGATDTFRDPQTTPFNTAGSTTMPIPSWCNHLDIIALGGGGGGHQGGTWGVGGEGGDNGAWATATWDRGTHFTAGTISITVGGPGSAGFGGNGGNGGASTVSITGYTVTATGGAGANSFDIVGSEHAGESPGNLTFGGQQYVGGVQQNSYGALGAAPGGGGAGGNWVSFQPGGAGSPGAVWIRAYQ